jgi:hypothetical protein
MDLEENNNENTDQENIQENHVADNKDKTKRKYSKRVPLSSKVQPQEQKISTTNASNPEDDFVQWLAQQEEEEALKARKAFRERLVGNQKQVTFQPTKTKTIKPADEEIEEDIAVPDQFSSLQGYTQMTKAPIRRQNTTSGINWV